MNTKLVMRISAAAMLAVAVAFLGYALTHPEAGTAFYIGELRVGSDIWRAFYVLYSVVMLGIFVGSFFVKGKRKS